MGNAPTPTTLYGDVCPHIVMCGGTPDFSGLPNPTWANPNVASNSPEAWRD